MENSAIGIPESTLMFVASVSAMVVTPIPGRPAIIVSPGSRQSSQ